MKDNDSIKKDITDILKEVFKYVNSDSGETSIHINLNKSNDNKDFMRQSFMFYSLNYVLYHFKTIDLIDEELRVNLIENIKVMGQFIFKYLNEHSDSNNQENIIENKYVELNLLRSSILGGKLDLIDFWSRKVEQNLKVVFKQPLLLALYIKTMTDLNKLNIKIDFLQYHLPTAIESFYAWTKIEPNNSSKSFNYIDYYYFTTEVGADLIYMKQINNFIESKLKSEWENIEDFNTSCIVKICEGLTYKKLYCDNVYHDNDILLNIEKYLKVIFDRKIKLSNYLIENHKYGVNSLSEVKNTSYVCLDTYGHLIIVFVNLLLIKNNK